MVKLVRIPLTDQYNRDFITGKVVESQPIAQSVDLSKKITNWLIKKQGEAKSIGRDDGKIHIEGFGWVKI